MNRRPEPTADAFAASQGMHGYENLSDSNPRRARERAERVLAEGWSHRGKYEPCPVLAPYPWSGLDPGETSLNFHLHSLDPVHDLLAGHSAVGDRRFFDAALGFALDWIDNHECDPSGSDGFAWYDMAVGVRCYRLAYLLDFARRGGVGKEACDRLWTMVRRHADYLGDDANIVFHNNHGLYQVAGQLAMARRFAPLDPAMARARDQGSSRLLAMIRNQFTEEGVHKEHSPDYHRMVYDTLKGLLAAGLVTDPELAARCEAIEASLAWFVAPDGTLANFGDTDIRDIRCKPGEAGRRWHFDTMQYVASGGLRGAPPRQTWRAFTESGYFVARDAWPGADAPTVGGSYLAQAAAFHSRTHKHADDLSFVWFEQGRPILVDAGRYGYFGKTAPESELQASGNWYSDPYRVFVESTRAHNTVEIDGKDHCRRTTLPYGSALKRSAEAEDGAVAGESETSPSGTVRHHRVLAYKPGRWLLVCDRMHDDAGLPHDFLQWFHFAPGLDVREHDQGFLCERPGLPAVNVIALVGSPSRHRSRGQMHPRIQGFFSPRERVVEENEAVAFGQAGIARAAFATLFVLVRPGEPPVRAHATLTDHRIEVAFEDGHGWHRIEVGHAPAGRLSLASASVPPPETTTRTSSP